MGRGERTRWAVGVVVCGLLLASVAGGVVTAQESDALRFADAVTTEQRGDVAHVPIRVGDRRHVTLTVRAPDGTYDTQVRVADVDGDGRVTVALDTFSAGWAADEATAYAAGDGDRITDVDRRTSRLDEPLPERRYNLVVAAGGESTSAALVIEPGTVGNATAATIPAARLTGDATAVPTTPRFETGTVAIDDHAVFVVDASGLGGVLASTAPPAENLVYPIDSTPGATTTHVVGVDADRRVTPETVTVRYADGGTPQHLDHVRADRLRALGIDTDGDGIVETDLRSAVERVEAGDSETALTLHLDTDATVAAGETLLLSYRATNPASGTYAVDASMGDADGSARVDAEGRVVYGPAGRGTLGYGLDLRFTADGGEPVVDPLAAVDYVYVDDQLYVLVNTSALAVDGRYGVGLIRWGASPLGDETVVAGASVRLTERRATLIDPASADRDAGSKTIRATTTLAPTTEVVVDVSGDAPNDFLFRQTTRVGDDRTITATFDLPAGVDPGSVTVRIVDDGTVLARGVIATESGGE
jgi:hypothetical protein